MIPVVPGAAQRHLRRDRPPISIPAGDSNHAQGSARVTTLGITITDVPTDRWTCETISR